MAGVVPFVSSTPGRKQWNIKDRKSSRRLRHQLAEDGCPESQLALAKVLLEGKNSVNDDESEKNARLGVFWLIKASEQGNVEATNILKKCLETGEGITEHNYLDVKACINTAQNEKLAKRAAREMFMSLSAGQDFITSEQLRRRMRKIDLCEPVSRPTRITLKSNSESNSVEGEKDPDNSVGDNDCNYEVDCDCLPDLLGLAGRENFGEKLTEDHLENAAVTYSRGEMPLVQRVLALTDPRNRDLENMSYLQRALLHPFRTVQQSCLKLLDRVNSRHGSRLFSFALSPSLIQMVLILIFYPFVNFENMLVFIPMLVYLMSFFVMVFSTLQMLNSKNEYSNFRVWSRLFLSYDRDGSLNTDDAEFEYCKKNLRPFIVYFVSLLVNLVVYPFVSELWIPQSEFAVIAIALTFTTLYFFHEKIATRKIDFLMLVSFAIYVIAKYPYETDGVVRQTWRFLDIELPTLQSYDLPCFASQIVGYGVEFCLNFRFFFFLLMPPIFVKMASREDWKGTYKVLIPHCVTLSWWQIAVLCCQGATLYGLIRSMLALIGLIFFLPIIGIATVLLPFFTALKHFTDVTLTPKTGLTVILASIPLGLAYILDKRRGVQTGTYVSKVQIFLAIVSALLLLGPSLNQQLTDTTGETEIAVQPVITWDQYSSLCRRTAWQKEKTMAEIQHDCVHFEGVTVHWEGIVEDVRIVKISNALQKILDNLPRAIASKLLCMYGEMYEEDCNGLSDELKAKFCQTVKQIKPHKCHIRSWDKYEFEIKMKMKSNAWSGVESMVRLEVDDHLRNFTLRLRGRDHVWFSGTLSLVESIGREDLTVAVDEIGCISCHNKGLTSQKREKSRFRSENFFSEIRNGLKRVLNFIFNPVFMFR